MIDDQTNQSPLAISLRQLNHLAKKIKQRRIEKGALTLASTQVKFSFSEETHNPTDVQFYPEFETNSLVEEFMLLSNISVARKIVSTFPSLSVLRQHNQPKPKEIN